MTKDDSLSWWLQLSKHNAARKIWCIVLHPQNCLQKNLMGNHGDVLCSMFNQHGNTNGAFKYLNFWLVPWGSSHLKLHSFRMRLLAETEGSLGIHTLYAKNPRPAPCRTAELAKTNKTQFKPSKPWSTAAPSSSSKSDSNWSLGVFGCLRSAARNSVKIKPSWTWKSLKPIALDSWNCASQNPMEFEGWFHVYSMPGMMKPPNLGTDNVFLHGFVGATWNLWPKNQ